MFPTIGDVHLAPFTDEQLYMEQFTKANFWWGKQAADRRGGGNHTFKKTYKIHIYNSTRAHKILQFPNGLETLNKQIPYKTFFVLYGVWFLGG